MIFRAWDARPEHQQESMPSAGKEAEVSARKFHCPGCGYIYDEALGEPHEGFAPGTRWEDIPEAWFCPDCAVRDKADFILEGGADGGATQPADAESKAYGEVSS